VFNSPSNPGGFSYAPEEVRKLAAVVADRDVVVFSDEMYDRLLFGQGRAHLSFANASPAVFDKTITINAVSKSHAMTGWRAGFAAGPRELISGMARIQSHSTSGTATFIQYALAEALTGDQSHVETMRREFERRGRHMYLRLSSMPGVKCFAPTGAFYCFPDVSETYPRLGVADSSQFCAKALEEAHVALVPGAAFGMDTHVRLSFATDLETIDRGLDRLAKFLKQ
jgi:aspartate aminotransferase